MCATTKTRCSQTNTYLKKEFHQISRIIVFPLLCPNSLVQNIVSNVDLSSIFFYLCAQERETKTEINKWDYIKLRFCIVTESSNKMKR